MKVRPDLTNKIKGDAQAPSTTARTISHSFSSIFSERIASRRSVGEPLSGLPHSGRGQSPSPTRYPPAQHSRQPAHLANTGNHKAITMTQANRLAKYAPTIQECSKRHNVPVELICGVILQESGGNHKAVSHAGAKGLMQLMPGTARRFGVTNSFDAKQNIEGGTKYLRFLLDRFNGNYKLALAGYNAGEANVEKYGNKIPPFAETKAYVPNVLGYADAIWNVLHPQPRPTNVAGTNLPSYAKKV